MHAGLHVGIAQLPFRHIEAAPEQMVPHPPQLSGSFISFTQALSQQ